MDDEAEIMRVIESQPSMRNMTSETLQLLRSHERIDDIRFKNGETVMKEIRDSIKDLTKKVEEGFKRNDNRFWSLGITFITMLISCCAFLIWKIING